MIEFKSVKENFKMFAPDGNHFTQEIAHRVDPLTGVVATVNTFLGEKAKAFLGQADTALLEKLENDTKQNCPFCVAEKTGTRFSKEFVETGFIKYGNSIAVPNLFSKAGIDAVVIVNHTQHVLKPSKITSEDFSNAIKTGVDLIKRGRKFNNSFVHHVMGMNFLNPGGSSVPHPHFQVHLRSVPFSGVTNLLKLSDDYYLRTNKNYWNTLIDMEKKENLRFIGNLGKTNWIVPFAPAHQKEVWGVLYNKSTLSDLSEDEAEAFGKGIHNVVSFYEEEGHFAYTFAFISSPLPDKEKSFCLQVRLCARPAFKALYSNYDTWFTPKFIGDEVHTTVPEDYCQRLKKLFT